MTFATSQIPENLKEQIGQAAWLLAFTDDGFPPEEEIDRLFPPVFSQCQNCGERGICRKVKSYVIGTKDDEICEGCFTLLWKAFRAILHDDEEMFADCQMGFSAFGIYGCEQARQPVSSNATQWN